LKVTGGKLKLAENIIAIAISAVILVNVFIFLRFMCYNLLAKIGQETALGKSY